MHKYNAKGSTWVYCVKRAILWALKRRDKDSMWCRNHLESSAKCVRVSLCQNVVREEAIEVFLAGYLVLHGASWYHLMLLVLSEATGFWFGATICYTQWLYHNTNLVHRPEARTSKTAKNISAQLSTTQHNPAQLKVHNCPPWPE